MKAFTQALSDIVSLKAEDINIFGITVLVLVRFASGKAVTWKSMAQAHNATCHKALVVSEFSDGRGGLNFRNELFNIEHDNNHPLFGQVLFAKDMNSKVHSSDKKRRGFVKGVTLKKDAVSAANRKAVAKYYR